MGIQTRVVVANVDEIFDSIEGLSPEEQVLAIKELLHDADKKAVHALMGETRFNQWASQPEIQKAAMEVIK